ncbi:TIGR03089 family protein [Gordonia sp. ABSL1-1]|uniref:TIGR03089 family protein n=1 Tax=Gordonia sp. ABSL1-1 TaxID=3053923 RepID=UPI0025736815|nr:TIGR03089 family protein [Gordonia sp. ABSL1-1]MDL9937084.1 TIGR03089 family protein [Gordonia sp. ABSL1-1]
MTATRTVTDAVFAAVGDWTRPLLTYYNDDTGERTELSGATLGNWAAKTANFLVDEIGVLPGDRVRVDLPEHWQSAAILLGTWWTGAHIVLGSADDTDTDRAVFTSVARIDDHPDADELIVASLDAFALPLRDLPPGVADYASSVRVHGDQYASRASGETVLPGPDGSLPATIAAATDAAGRDAIHAGARVLTTREWHTADGVVNHLLAPLLAGASLVHVAGADPGSLGGRAESERADLILT